MAIKQIKDQDIVYLMKYLNNEISDIDFIKSSIFYFNDNLFKLKISFKSLVHLDESSLDHLRNKASCIPQETIMQELKYIENLSIYYDMKLPNLIHADHISIFDNTTLTANELQTAHIIDFSFKSTLIANKLEEMGIVNINNNQSVSIPNLKHCGSISMGTHARFYAPNLINAHDIYLHYKASLTAPNLTNANDIWLQDGASLNAYKLTKAHNICLYGITNFDAPHLIEMNTYCGDGVSPILAVPQQQQQTEINNGF